MSTFVSLGPRVQKGVAAPTNAPQNWQVIFDPATINCTMPYFEVSHISVMGAQGSSFTIYIDAQEWENVQNGYINSWDPVVPIPLHPGQYLYMYWSNPDTDGNPPTVTIWMRYDQDIIANRRTLTTGGTP